MTRAAVKDFVAREVLTTVSDAVARGDRGVVAIFWGPSGMNRTVAARVLAETLKYQLMQVNLAHSANKYIGETEKNIEAVFAAASQLPTVLLFDEADALFGKRTSVKDSHDRYANIEISFLLQRMESLQGVVVLSTSQLAALDDSFAKRARCIVCFKG